VFDISAETKHVRDMYGDTVHGRQTLIARRLLERGVRYVQLWHGAGQPWDHHRDIERNIRKTADEIDQPIAAFLTDLKQRGMLEDTLVVFTTEFGRMPTFQLNANGRDHNPKGFTVWLAGAGVKKGFSYGATDDFGYEAVDKPTSVYELHATILHLLGLDHERLSFFYNGAEQRLTFVHGRVIKEVLA
jgi:uncharacterized protein (DUF1501 family)